MTEFEKEQKLAETLKFYTESAEQGHAYAQAKLGLIYYTGQGVKEDYDEAMHWWTKAAEQGSAYAQVALGKLYYHGIGVEENTAEAVKWLKKAAEQGDADAKYLLNKKKWSVKMKDFVQLNAHGEQDNTSEQNAPTSPNHYKQGDIECIDAIRAALGKEGFEAYCIGNVIKYSWRYKHKNGLEDLKKARVYLNWTIEQKEK